MPPLPPLPTPEAASAAAAGLAAVIDTNAWLDLFVFRDARARYLAQALQQRRMRALRSGSTDAELQAVLQRPLFATKCDAQARSALLRDWLALARPVEPGQIRPAPWSCRDRDDQKFLDLAFSAGPAWLFTQDRALLSLARKARAAGVHILTPLAYAAQAAQGLTPETTLL